MNKSRDFGIPTPLYTVLNNSDLEIHRFWPKALQIHGFLKKKSLLVHTCNLTNRGFELHGFFLELKTAHLEALLYMILHVLDL